MSNFSDNLYTVLKHVLIQGLNLNSLMRTSCLG